MSTIYRSENFHSPSFIRQPSLSPAWRRICRELGLKERLIPRDVVTRWNSTYDMMKFVLAYRAAIDKITADKGIKLRKYELDQDDWTIIEDLVNILEVRHRRFI